MASDEEEHPIVGYTVAWSSVCLTDLETEEASASRHGAGVGTAAAVSGTVAAAAQASALANATAVPDDLEDMLARCVRARCVVPRWSMQHRSLTLEPRRPLRHAAPGV